MKRISMALSISLAMAMAIAAQTNDKQPLSKDQQEVAAVNRAWADAIVRGDMEALDRLFADEMTVLSGEVRNKAQEMDDLRPSADIKTYFFNTDDVRIRVYRDTAVITGHAKWRINLKGRDIDNERLYTLVVVKQKGRWQIVAQHLSRLNRPAPQ